MSEADCSCAHCFSACDATYRCPECSGAAICPRCARDAGQFGLAPVVKQMEDQARAESMRERRVRGEQRRIWAQ